MTIQDHEIQTRDAKIQSLIEENKLNKIEIQNCGTSFKIFEDKIYNEMKILIDEKTTIEREFCKKRDDYEDV